MRMYRVIKARTIPVSIYGRKIETVVNVIIFVFVNETSTRRFTAIFSIIIVLFSNACHVTKLVFLVKNTKTINAPISLAIHDVLSTRMYFST
jgi:hypothetical protein